MYKHPKTIRKARNHRYGQWAGNPLGDLYKEGHCAYEVMGDFSLFYQCSRKNGYGINKLYCKQHAKKIKELEG